MIRRLGSIIRVEFKRQLSGPTAWFFFLILPLIFTASVGAGLSGAMNAEPSDPQEVRTPLFLVAQDEGPLVEGLKQTLASLNIDLTPVDEIPDDSNGLIVPADFSARLLDSQPVTLTLQVQSTSGASPVIEESIRAAQGRVGGAALVAEMGLDQAQSSGLVATPEQEARFFRTLLLDTLEAVENPPVVAQVRWPDETTITRDPQTQITSQEHASAGQIVTWVQITLLGLAEVLVDERLQGTLRRVLITPTSRATLFAGKLLAGLSLGLVQMAILFAGGGLIFGVDWGQDLLAIALVSFAFALATAALGIVVATFVKTRGQANSIVIGLAMSMAALGGAWYPLEITPPLYRQIVQILPSNWAMRAYNAMLGQGATLIDVLPHIGALTGFAVLFLIVGVVRFRRYR
jgi:ABC-2 type transport system permease protein